MRSYLLIFFSLFFWLWILAPANAQLSVNKPIKSDLIIGPDPIPFHYFESIDNEFQLEKDKEARKDGKEFGMKFGEPILVDIDLFSDGLVTNFSGGASIYRLGISSKGAKTLNFVFDSFWLPDGAWMHIYSPSKKEVLGAFTKNNQSEKHLFATTLIASDSVVIEVYLPNNIDHKSVHIKSIVHGYRDFNQVIEAFGTSGDCNINVACPEGSAWSDQIRAVTLIVAGVGNNHICSGSLINNVKEDGTPYLLSAYHCPVNTNNVVIFNYQSPFCIPNTDSSFAHSINGLEILSRNGKSDFLLVQLSSIPPASYRPYYAGWNNSGIRPNSGTCIHHPDGDIKKISFDFKPSISKTYYNVGDDHWMVTKWNLGTTEPVSSGSPLFDENKLIVGQLHGGDALCDYPDEEDYFGKFSTSWNTFPDSAKQLKYWLDPNNSGATTQHGYDPLIPKGNVDLSLLGFVQNGTGLCGIDSIRPKIIVKNNGIQAVTNFQIVHYLNNILVSTENVSTNLAAGGTYIHLAASIPVKEGFYNIKALVKASSTDSNPLNNWAHSQLSISNDDLMVEFILKTDNDGAESNWELLSSSGSQLFSGGNYKSVPGGEEIRDTFCLYNGCFVLKFYDDYGDGICCGFGNGFYLMRDLSTGDTLFANYSFTSSDTSHGFCLGDSCSIRARATIVNVSSASAKDGSISLEMLSGVPPYTYNWSNGASSDQIMNLDIGSYWVVIEDSMNCTDSIFYEIGIGSNVHSAEKKNTEFRVYPNPSNGTFTFEGIPTGENFEASLYDQQGQEIRTSNGFVLDNKVDLQFNGLNSGIYFLRIITSKTAYQKRIMILE